MMLRASLAVVLCLTPILPSAGQVGTTNSGFLKAEAIAASGSPSSIAGAWNSILFPPDYTRGNAPTSMKALMLATLAQTNRSDTNEFQYALITVVLQRNPQALEGSDYNLPGVSPALKNQITQARPDLALSQLLSGTSDSETAALINQFGPTLALAQKLESHADWSQSQTAAVTSPQTHQAIIEEILSYATKDDARQALLDQHVQDPWLAVELYNTAQTPTVKAAAATNVQPYFIALFQQTGVGTNSSTTLFSNATASANSATAVNAQGMQQRNQQIYNDYGPDGNGGYKNATLFFAGLSEIASDRSQAPALMNQTLAAENQQATNPDLQSANYVALDAYAMGFWHYRNNMPGGTAVPNPAQVLGTTQSKINATIEQGDNTAQTWIATNETLNTAQLLLINVASRSNDPLLALSSQSTTVVSARNDILLNVRVNQDSATTILTNLFKNTAPSPNEITLMVQQKYPEELLNLAMQYNNSSAAWQTIAAALYPKLALQALQNNPDDYTTLTNVMNLRDDIESTDTNVNNAQNLTSAVMGQPTPSQTKDLTALKNAIVASALYGQLYVDQELSQSTDGFWPSPAHPVATSVATGTNAAPTNVQGVAAAGQNILTENAQMAQTSASLTNSSTAPEAAELAASIKQATETSTTPTTATPVTPPTTNPANMTLAQLQAALQTLTNQALASRATWEGRDDLKNMASSNLQWNLVPAAAKQPPYYDSTTQTANYYQYLKDQWEATYYGNAPGHIGYYQQTITAKQDAAQNQ